MNWMHESLARWSWRALLLGALGGMWGCLLFEAGLLLVAGGKEGGWALLPELLPGLLLGAGLGAALAPVDDLIRRMYRRALRHALAGAVLGAAAGAGGLGVLDAIQPWWGAGTGALVYWLLLPLALALLGAAIACASALGGRAWRASLSRAAHGAWIGALAGALAAALLAPLGAPPGSELVAFALWSAAFCWALFWREKRFARRWLRLITAPGDDAIHPLPARTVSLGKLESNDIPLPHHHDVFPIHCTLTWDKDHHTIIDEEQGGLVLVNFRQVQEQALKPGDLVKVGSALLQYGEA
ncbi:MAG: FHA domain-containing protein [Candidatus Lambdaproteobacteria bacterium]|nr:FHA domain-containing protein [Candidatus Lambdaproteobacteria bacterium]